MKSINNLDIKQLKDFFVMIFIPFLYDLSGTRNIIKELLFIENEDNLLLKSYIDITQTQTPTNIHIPVHYL